MVKYCQKYLAFLFIRSHERAGDVACSEYWLCRCEPLSSMPGMGRGMGQEWNKESQRDEERSKMSDAVTYTLTDELCHNETLCETHEK